MRNILDKILVLQESTGLANRKPGEVFRNSDGDEITFNSIEFFPKAGGTLDSDQLEIIKSQVESEADNNVEWLNKMSSRTGGFAIIVFDSPQGPLYYGRYLESVKPNKTDNFIPNIAGDYKFAGKAAVKLKSGLTPQDLLTNKIDLTAEEIVEQLRDKLGENNVLYQVAARLADNEPLPMTFDAPEDVSFPAFRDYFCEILQPIALQAGQYTGNAGEAAEIFLGGSFKDTVISFDTSKTAGLSDSIMTNESGKNIKVSTKGGLGATASTSNLISSLDELSLSDNGKELIDKYSDTIDIIKEIQKQGQYGSPLYLGVMFDIIDKEDAAQIVSMRRQPNISMDDIDSLDISNTLKKLAKSRKTDNPDNVSLFYHLMAAVAHKAAEEVNDKTDFSKAAADILNNGALVQVYTKAKEKAGKWTLEEFNTVFPGDSIKGVYLTAAKSYYSTGVKGNFTFKIDKGKGKPKDEDNESEGPGREKRSVSDKQFAAKAKDIATGINRPELKARSLPTGEVGRKKR